MKTEPLQELIDALRSYEQADMDGTVVRVSRQACEEGADAIERLQAENAALRELVKTAMPIWRENYYRSKEWWDEARKLTGESSE